MLDDKNGEFLIKAIKMTKTYEETKLQAVSANSFGVREGEVLGLLGPNGAGKTTTFDMLAMRSGKTSGEARILNKNVDNINLGKYGRYVGHCP